MMNLRSCSVLSVLFLALCCTQALYSQAPEPLTFRHAIDLALKNSTSIAIADADQKRAKSGYQEQRNMFLPQMTLGSGVAYSNGFPLSIEGSAPTIISVNSQQYLINAAQREFTRAAKTELEAMTSMGSDRRAQVILETAMAYTELDKLQDALKALQQQTTTAQKVESVTRDRLAAGVDSEVEVTRARLGVSRVRLAQSQAEGQAEMLRLRLSQLTGLPPEAIVTVPESIPRLPDVSDKQSVMQKAMSSSLAIDVVTKQATAKEFRAKGENRALYPMVDLAGQYGLLAKYNNYEDFFKSFQRHNVTVGFVIRFPFLNFAQRSRAQAADADALKAKKEVEATKHQVVSDTMRLQHSVNQLAAAKEVTRLEYQLATSDSQAMQARVEAGSANLRDLENSRLLEHRRYSAFLDASVELDKAQMQLLKLTGEIEKWALGQ